MVKLFYCRVSCTVFISLCGVNGMCVNGSGLCGGFWQGGSSRTSCLVLGRHNMGHIQKEAVLRLAFFSSL